MKNSILLGVSVLAFILAGCSMKHRGPVTSKSIVKLEAKSGSKAGGTLFLEDHAGGVMISGKVSGLKPGLHGFHIHENGDCKSKDASSAGSHFQIGAQVHGDRGGDKAHAGDLGNIEANKEGVAEISLHIAGITLGSGAQSIANRSLVIHADKDDLKSQPVGSSGKRIACGVIKVWSCSHCGDWKSGDCCSKEGCTMKTDCPSKTDCPMNKDCAGKKKTKA